MEMAVVASGINHDEFPASIFSALLNFIDSRARVSLPS